MKRILPLAIMVGALLAIASLAGYNAYGSYLVGRSMRRAVEMDAEQTRVVLELPISSDQMAYEAAFAICRRSLQARKAIRQELLSLNPADLESLRAQILRFLDLEDHLVEAKRMLLESQLDLRRAEQQLSAFVEAKPSISANDEVFEETTSRAGSVVTEEAEKAWRSAQLYLHACEKAIEAAARLRRSAEVAGMIVPDILAPLERANREGLEQTLEAAGFDAPRGDHTIAGNAGALPAMKSLVSAGQPDSKDRYPTR